jgi:Ca-activated chloride channel family protein
MENFEWNNLSLGEPYWLFLLLLLPGVLWLSRRKKKTQAIKFPSIVEIKTTRKSWKTKLLWLPKLFFYLGLALTVLSISRPRLDQSTQKIVSSGVDIVLGVDLSASMLALDMSPSPSEPNTRLDVVKEVIQEFIEKRKFDRIGLVAFAVDPYLVSALTLDKEYLQSNLARLKGWSYGADWNQHWFRSCRGY